MWLNMIDDQLLFFAGLPLVYIKVHLVTFC